MRPSGRITSPDVKPGCRPGGAYHEKFHINIYIYIYSICANAAISRLHKNTIGSCWALDNVIKGVANIVFALKAQGSPEQKLAL